MGERGKPIDVMTRTRIRRLLGEDMPIKQICRVCHVHRNTVRRERDNIRREKERRYADKQNQKHDVGGGPDGGFGVEVS